MNIAYLIASILIAVLGILLFIYGGADDSPGAQFLGLVIFAGSLILFAKKRKAARKQGG